MNENSPTITEEQQKLSEDKPKKVISLTLILATIPAYIYFVSFEYELGYCDYFNIPRYLIEPSLTTILIFAATLSGILFS